MSQFVHPEFLRIGDSERDRALHALSEHFAQGRLTAEEFDVRSDQVWGARTTADLRPVFTDLPGGLPLAAPVPVGRRGGNAPSAYRRTRRRRGIPGILVMVFLVVAVLTVLHHPWILAVIAGVWLFSRRR